MRFTFGKNPIRLWIVFLAATVLAGAVWAETPPELTPSARASSGEASISSASEV